MHHRTQFGRDQERSSVYTKFAALVAHTSSVLLWHAEVISVSEPRGRGDAFDREGNCAVGSSSKSRPPIDPPVEAGATLAPADVFALLQALSEYEPMPHGYGSTREPSQRALATIHWLPPVLFDEQENISFHVKKLLQKRRRHGHNQYLVQ